MLFIYMILQILQITNLLYNIYRPQQDTLEYQQQQQQQSKSNPGMSTSAAIVGASVVALGATAAAVIMFGNVSATSNNLGVSLLF